MSKRKILVVDDEPNIRRILQAAFEKAGYQALTAEDAREALSILESDSVDCVLTDVTMPGMSGYDLLRAVKDAKPDLPVIVMTAYGTIPQAIQAIRDGAHEYVTKPFDLDVLKKVIESAFVPEAKIKRASSTKAKQGKQSFIAESDAMKEVFELVEQVADSKATVMVWGESGVGKEVVAKALHTMSARASRPFVAVSCAALPETLLESELFGYEKGAFTGAQAAKAGRFETAHTGTLFLDEVGEIPAGVQVKLLRVLQEREFERLGANKPTRVDVRLVTATNRDLREAVDQGSFRLDLLYRLQVVELYIPPLRERLGDIIPLANHFLVKYCAENDRALLHVTPDAEKTMLAYRWPGNVRELENAMERAVVLAPGSQDSLTSNLLPTALRRSA